MQGSDRAMERAIEGWRPKFSASLAVAHLTVRRGVAAWHLLSDVRLGRLAQVEAAIREDGEGRRNPALGLSIARSILHATRGGGKEGASDLAHVRSASRE